MEIFKPDCILAIGGGSVMDTAKALAVFYEHPSLTWKEATQFYKIPPIGKKALLVAVPTTSGTGSETTMAAVFNNDETNESEMILSPEILPSIAILDADFVDSMPNSVAAISGMDALIHAMEALISTSSSPMAYFTGMSASLEIFEYLPPSIHPSLYKDKGDIAREYMHVASSLSGMTINNAYTGLAHALNQPGSYFDLPHGVVGGILFPYTTKYLMPKKTYGLLARRMGYTGSDKEVCKDLLKHIIDLKEEIGIPKSFKEIGVNEEAFMNRLDKFVESASYNPSVNMQIKEVTKKDLENILIDSYYGHNLID